MNLLKNYKVLYKPKNKVELKNLVEDSSVNLWEIDTSLITDMCYIFHDSKRTNDEFEGIEFWNTTNVQFAAGMFLDCKTFNRNISLWDVKNMRYISYMFSGCESFECSLANWKLDKVISYTKAFKGCKKIKLNKNYEYMREEI